MDGEDQAQAYAQADFSEPHDHFIELLGEAFPDLPDVGTALDLGCGPGDISMRFARAFEGWIVHGLDGSRAMLRHGYEAVAQAGLSRLNVRQVSDRHLAASGRTQKDKSIEDRA